MSVDAAYAEVERITRRRSPLAHSRGGNHVSPTSPLLLCARLVARGAEIAALHEDSNRGNLPVSPFPFHTAGDPQGSWSAAC